MMKNLFITAMCICLMTLAGCNKVSADTDSINPKVQAVLAGKYPGAVIKDVEYDDGLIEVEIIHDGRGKDVYLTKDFVWVRSEWDVRKAELPAAVLSKITSDWPAWKIDNAEYFETPTGSWYEIELEQGDSELDIKISPDGIILK